MENSPSVRHLLGGMHAHVEMKLIAVTLVPTRGASRTKNRAADNGNTEFRTIRTEVRLLFLYPVLWWRVLPSKTCFKVES